MIPDDQNKADTASNRKTTVVQVSPPTLPVLQRLPSISNLHQHAHTCHVHEQSHLCKASSTIPDGKVRDIDESIGCPICMEGVEREPVPHRDPVACAVRHPELAFSGESSGITAKHIRSGDIDDDEVQ